MFAAAVLSLAALLPAAEAQAKSNINLNIGVGVGGYYGPAYDPHYCAGVVVALDGVSCSQARKIVKGEGFYNVKSIDCSEPSYNFTGWRDGDKYKVRVNSYGEITRIKPM